MAARVGLEFLTGYLVEKALAVDNVFVFVLVFGYFGVPPRHQHRVLFYGILGALVFRAVFVALGAVLMRYHAVVVAFGIVLLFSGVKMLFAPTSSVDPAGNPLIRLVRRVLPVTAGLHGQAFLVRLAGRLHATPLLVALLVLEVSDIVFAVDSVPAIFAITARAAPGLHLERVRHPRPAGDVLPARRRRAAVPPAALWARRWCSSSSA